jgi:hypothetical protein
MVDNAGTVGVLVVDTYRPIEFLTSQFGL